MRVIFFMAKKISQLTAGTITNNDWVPIERSATSNFRLNLETAINSTITSNVGSLIQEWDAQLDEIVALTGPGVATKTGSTWSITGTSTGGNAASDSGKLAKFDSSGYLRGEIVFGDSQLVAGIESGGPGASLVIYNSSGFSATLGAQNLTGNHGTFEFPEADGTLWTFESFTTVGGSLATLTNPSAIRFLRINANNSVSALDAASFRTAISALGAGSITTSGLTITSSRLLGRTTASTGAVEEITVSSPLTFTSGALGANTSTGGNAAGDGGKIAVYDSTGNLRAEQLYSDDKVVVGSPVLSGSIRFYSGSFTVDLVPPTLTDDRFIEFPDEAGTVVVRSLSAGGNGASDSTKIPVFDSNGAITTSSLISKNSLLVGAASTTTGSISIYDSGSAFGVTFTLSGTLSADRTIELPDQDGVVVVGTVSATQTADAIVQADNDGIINYDVAASSTLRVGKVGTDGSLQIVNTSGNNVTLLPSGLTTTRSFTFIDDSGIIALTKWAQNSRSADYTFALTDDGKHVYHPSADTSGRTWTIPANASVAFPIGSVLRVVNDSSAGVITIAITSDTLVLAGAGTTGSRSLAADGYAEIVKIGTTRWQIHGTGLT